MRYTKGMRVRCTKSYYPGKQFTAGKEYVIRVDDDEDCRVVADDTGEPNGWSGEFFEIVRPFKVGDRVRVARNPSNGGYGEVGDVGVVVYTGNAGNCVVSFEDGKQAGQEWWVDCVDLEPATPTIQAGKFYRTRDGRKVGPTTHNGYGVYGAPGYPNKWYETGRSYADKAELPTALIAEWVDEPDANDALAAAVKDSIGATMTWLHGASPFVIEDGEVKIRGMQFAPTTPAIVCLMRDGRPYPSDKPHVHASSAEAEKEAARLARKHPGREFAVFEMGAVTKHAPAHEWQRLALEGKQEEAAAALQESAGVDKWAAQNAVYNFTA